MKIAAKAGSSPLERYPEAAELFKKVVQERHGTEDDDKILRHVWVDISFAMLDVPDVEFFTIRHMRIEVPEYARIFTTVTCTVCGVNVMESRARLIDGKPVCIPCSGNAYFHLTGDGISAIVPGSE